MQRSKMAILTAICTLMMVAPSIAFAAQSDADDIFIGVKVGQEALANAVAGGTAGVFLSTVVVIGKHINNEANKKPDPKRYGLNILIGALTAVLVGLVPGINQVVGSDAITFGTAFALLFVVDNVVRPIYGNWAKGEKASANGKNKKEK